MTDLITQTQTTILQNELAEHKQHNQRAIKLLKLGGGLTFLLYLAFALHLYLGDPLSWAAYFTTWQSTIGFFFMLTTIGMTALFLAWVKHHAYLHFGFYGSITMIVVTVTGFALFAEFFSSSAAQDAKSNIVLERSSAFQDTRQSPSLGIAPSAHLTDKIATTRQTLARCEVKLSQGKEKTCEGDKGKLQALLDSEQRGLQAQIQASTASQALKYERQDQLKADSYNPVIVMMAQFMSWFSGADYKDHIKTAVVFIMLIVAVSFEILHHFLSTAKGQSTAAIKTLELQLAELQTQSASPAPQVTPSMPNYKASMGFNTAAPTVASHIPSVQSLVFNPAPLTQAEPESRPIGFIIPKAESRAEQIAATNRVHTPTHTQHTPNRVCTPTHLMHTGAAEEQIPLFGTYLGKALATGKANTDAEVKAHLASVHTPPAETVCTHPRTPTTDRVHTPTYTPKATPSLYAAWLTAIHAGECNPTVRATRPWVQQRIAGKGSQALRKTPTPVDIDAITTDLFQRATKDPNSGIRENPNYSKGKVKYLLEKQNA